MKKIIYLFCLICTITLAKGQYYRPDHGFFRIANICSFFLWRHLYSMPRTVRGWVLA